MSTPDRDSASQKPSGAQGIEGVSVPLSSGLTFEDAEPIDESDPDVIRLREFFRECDRARAEAEIAARSYVVY